MLKIDIFDTPDDQTLELSGVQNEAQSRHFRHPRQLEYQAIWGVRMMHKIDIFDTADRQTLELSWMQNDAPNRHILRRSPDIAAVWGLE